MTETIAIEKTILDHFPRGGHIKEPRKTQVQVLHAIEKAFKDGYKNVLLEAPVGSGKSAIAITAANFYGSAHILTPRKSLQDQYLDDFRSKGLALMKGRNAYPCVYPATEREKEYNRVVKLITSGGLSQPTSGILGCDRGPCKNNTEEYSKCTGFRWNGGLEDPETHPCPYSVAIGVAQQSHTVIHNLHSFIFQAYFTNRFDERKILIVDECHEMESIIRGFAEVKVIVPFLFDDSEIPKKEDYPTMDKWASWLGDFADKLNNRPRMDGTTERGDYLETLQKMSVFSEQFGEEFVVDWEEGRDGRSTKFSFIPVRIGSLVNKFLLQFGQKRLLMSGTIYNKKEFCRKNGLSEEETCFMRIGSSFPLDSRPIYCKSEYMVDTSHKGWDNNFSEMIEKIEKICDIFHDAKGLIHTPSYQASLTVYNALRQNGRVMIHNKDNFQEKLLEFYNSSDPKVFLSPICQQGVDFKHDRARFQIVLRVPYANTADPYIKYLVENDFSGYNYQALVIFGQQIGRINRSDDDYGVTILMDERFNKFISKNRNILPKWLLDALIYK